jgi:hypothetical protein
MIMNANDLFKAVMELDLEPIKTKLMHVESGEGWDLEKANAVEKEYRRYLCMMKLYPQEDIAPIVLVDTFWHYHILDTMKYAKDCDKIFGYFLHHYPYVGLGGEDDQEERHESGERMRVLYEATFGETYPGARATAADTGADPDAAFCKGMSLAPAFSAGPSHPVKLAFCQGASLATAFSAGPSNPAFCKGKSLATAFSAGPSNPAFCKGKSLATAFSAGPSNPAFCKGKSLSTAFSAGPSHIASGKADFSAGHIAGATPVPAA